jgi:excisionase family DNA binding protein
MLDICARLAHPETVIPARPAQAAKEAPVPSSTPDQSHRPERLLTPAEVAALFGVKTRAVRGWADARKLTVIRTLGGHRRYRESEVRALHAARRTEAVAACQ